MAGEFGEAGAVVVGFEGEAPEAVASANEPWRAAEDRAIQLARAGDTRVVVVLGAGGREVIGYVQWEFGPDDAEAFCSSRYLQDPLEWDVVARQGAKVLYEAAVALADISNWTFSGAAECPASH